MKATKIIYDFSLDQLTELIASDLNLAKDRIRVEFVRDETTQTITTIRVHVDNICTVL